MVDRDWPTTHEYKSKKYMVDFKWGEPGVKIPIFGKVHFEDDTYIEVLPSKPWGTIEEAKEDVISQVETMIDQSASK